MRPVARIKREAENVGRVTGSQRLGRLGQTARAHILHDRKAGRLPEGVRQDVSRRPLSPASMAPVERIIAGGTLLVVTTTRDLALCRAMLPERRTGATLGDMQLRSDLLNAGTATRGA